MKPLALGLVTLSALAAGVFVSAVVAHQLVAIAAPLGWWALLLLVWPTVLSVASSSQLDL